MRKDKTKPWHALLMILIMLLLMFLVAICDDANAQPSPIILPRVKKVGDSLINRGGINLKIQDNTGGDGDTVTIDPSVGLWFGAGDTLTPALIAALADDSASNYYITLSDYCTGDSSNDSAGFAAALAAVQAVNGVLMVPVGQYWIGTPDNIDSAVTIVGASREKSILYMSDSTYWTTSSNFTMANLTIMSDAAEATGYGSLMYMGGVSNDNIHVINVTGEEMSFRFGGCDNFSMAGCKINGGDSTEMTSSGAVTLFSGCTHGIISDCEIYNTGGDTTAPNNDGTNEILIYADAEYVKVLNCDLHGSGHSGVALLTNQVNPPAGGHKILIEGCNIYDHDVHNGLDLNPTPYDYDEQIGVQVRNCWFYDNNAAQIYINGSDVSIIGCTFEAGNSSGIYATDQDDPGDTMATGIQIIGNTFKNDNATVSGTNDNEIFLNYVAHCQISNNVFDRPDSGDQLIHVVGYANQITNNMLDLDTAGVTGTSNNTDLIFIEGVSGHTAAADSNLTYGNWGRYYNSNYWDIGGWPVINRLFSFGPGLRSSFYQSSTVGNTSSDYLFTAVKSDAFMIGSGGLSPYQPIFIGVRNSTSGADTLLTSFAGLYVEGGAASAENTGNVGVKQTSPNYGFDVNDSAIIRGVLYVDTLIGDTSGTDDTTWTGGPLGVAGNYVFPATDGVADAVLTAHADGFPTWEPGAARGEGEDGDDITWADGAFNVDPVFVRNDGYGGDNDDGSDPSITNRPLALNYNADTFDVAIYFFDVDSNMYTLGLEQDEKYIYLTDIDFYAMQDLMVNGVCYLNQDSIGNDGGFRFIDSSGAYWDFYYNEALDKFGLDTTLDITGNLIVSGLIDTDSLDVNDFYCGGNFWTTADAIKDTCIKWAGAALDSLDSIDVDYIRIDSGMSGVAGCIPESLLTFTPTDTAALHDSLDVVRAEVRDTAALVTNDTADALRAEMVDSAQAYVADSADVAGWNFLQGGGLFTVSDDNDTTMVDTAGGNTNINLNAREVFIDSLNGVYAYFTGNIITNSGNVQATNGAVTATGASGYVQATVGRFYDALAAANPTTDAAGEMAIDTDGGLEIYSSRESASVLISEYDHFCKSIEEPDQLSISPTIFEVDSLTHPHGVDIDRITIRIPADAAYQLVLEEWSGADTSAYQNPVDTIATGASDTYAIETTFTDGHLDPGDIIRVNLPATDVDEVMVCVTFHITEGD